MASSQLTEKIIDCTESFQSFNLYAPHILKDIFSNPHANFKPFLVVVYRILEEKEESPVNKFYALYLLAWILQKNPSEDFVEALFEHRDLISIIFNAGQYDLDNGTRVSERGRTFFNNHPQTDEAIIGINFVRLSLELIMYVKQILEEKRGNYAFSTYLFNIEEMTHGRELPMKNWLIGVQHSENIELATYNFINPSSSRGPINSSNPAIRNSTTSEQQQQQSEIRVQNYPKLNSCQIQNDIDSPTTAAAKQKAQQVPEFGGSGGVEEYRKAPPSNPSNTHNRISSAGKSPLDFGKKKTLGERMAEQGIFSVDSRTPRRGGPSADQTPMERSNSNLRTKRTPGYEPTSPLNKSNSAQGIRDFFSSRQKQPNQARQAGTITQVWDPQPDDNFRDEQDTDRILQGANKYGGEGNVFNNYDVSPYSKQQFPAGEKNFEAPKRTSQQQHIVQGGFSGHDDFETQKENALLKERIRELESEIKGMKTSSDQNLARENVVLKNKLADLVQKTEGLNNTIKGLVDENCQLSDSLQQKSKEIEDLKKAQVTSARQPSLDSYKKPAAVEIYDRPGVYSHHDNLHAFPTASKDSSSSPNNFYISSVKEPDSGSERTAKQAFRSFQATPLEENKPYLDNYGIKQQQQQQFGNDGKKQVVVDTYNYPPAGVGHAYSYSGAGTTTGVTSKPYEGYGEAPKGFLQETQQSTDDLYGQNAGGKRKLFEKVTYEKPKMVLTAKDYI